MKELNNLDLEKVSGGYISVSRQFLDDIVTCMIKGVRYGDSRKVIKYQAVQDMDVEPGAPLFSLPMQSPFFDSLDEAREYALANGWSTEVRQDLFYDIENVHPLFVDSPLFSK